MPTESSTILAHLDAVGAERTQRLATPGLHERVQRIKTYQQQRFANTYADLLATPRYGAAARFFLDELYGPRDFAERDKQFARVVPALVRLFPKAIVATVATLAGLHALSERLDTAMAGHLEAGAPLDAMAYLRAWQRTGDAPQRERQIALMIEVGAALDRLTRNLLVRNSLRLMRPAARAAGLAELQTFLEAGFDTFKAMRGAGEFLATVGTRERRLAQALFATPDAAVDAVQFRSLLALLPGSDQR
jgi:hypothetical protein